ncbi:uncharacterized protein LOC125374167 [Haliotis rufescens]|uniref:uncharacterized protein LOC125374167 n=1 Tax=Haliotis rufescens TaxID=6454 RepID=UPI00201EA809|nr:uncharacterized protein LOC125374167 [Haliotis rufescens]
MTHYGLSGKMAFAYALVLAGTMKGSTAADVSSIYCGDICSATAGRSYTLTCTLSGNITTGIIWEKNITQVLTCTKAGVCLSSMTNYATGTYPTLSTAKLTITSFDFATDGGSWECVDGTDQRKSCNLNAID